MKRDGRTVNIIGGGPAGLMAAEQLAMAGCVVRVYDRMARPGRKFLMAGRGGLNLSHSEETGAFLGRYGHANETLHAAIEAFPPQALRAWCEGLGFETFTGSSGRVFPRCMKASPLLRAWLQRLADRGVTIFPRHEWKGWTESGDCVFAMPGGEMTARADATLLALGGGSWARLGSDGGWAGILRAGGVETEPFRPMNCGFHVAWSARFRERFAGVPLKTVMLHYGGKSAPGEAMITVNGIEGGAVYALSDTLRDHCPCVLQIDLKPGLALEVLVRKLARPRGGGSFSTWVRKAAGLDSVAVNLLREWREGAVTDMDPTALGALIKAFPLAVSAPFPIDRAISTGGGVAWGAVDDAFMLKAKPGVFVAGEMLDWEAPTGGYLLQGCFATGVAAARGVLGWLEA